MPNKCRMLAKRSDCTPIAKYRIAIRNSFVSIFHNVEFTCKTLVVVLQDFIDK